MLEIKQSIEKVNKILILPEDLDVLKNELTLGG